MRKFIQILVILSVIPQITNGAEYPTEYVKTQCAKAKNPSHCVKVSEAIATSESGKCSKAVSNNCWGFRRKKYESTKKAFDVWFKSYNRYWYKAKDGTFFYGPHKSGTSYYCTDEKSSGTMGWCPNGKKTFNSVFFKK